MSEQYIRYEPRLRVMICRLCHGGVSKNGVAQHYRVYHKILSLHLRQNILKYTQNFDICETHEIQYPNTIIPYIEDLAVNPGVRCLYDNCMEASKEDGGMKEHCKKNHEWIVSKGILLRQLFLT